MYRSALFVLAVTLAPACRGQPPLTAREAAVDPSVEIDRRAERLALRGRWDEARSLVERGLADARARGDRAAEARLVLRRGRTVSDQIRHRGGDRSAALVDLEAARRVAETLGDRAILAASLDALGMHRFTHWFSTQDPVDLAGADELFRQALAIREPAGDSGALAESHFHAALVFQMRGDRARAQQELERALAIAERVHDEMQISYAARHLGYMAELRHDWALAEQHYRRSLELREQVGAGPGVAAAQITLAELRYARDGNAGPALALLTRARDGAEAAGSPVYMAAARAAIARVDRDQGRYDDAVRGFAAAIATIDAIHSDEDVPENYEQLALVHLLAGQPAAAVAAAERGHARRATRRLGALVVLARARAGQPTTPASPATPAEAATDPVVTARLALAAGQPAVALDAAIAGDDPDTLLLAALAVGRDGLARARPAAAAMLPAQALRFDRALAALHADGRSPR